MEISKELVWDYDACLIEALLLCGGQACLERFKKIKQRILENKRDRGE